MFLLSFAPDAVAVLDAGPRTEALKSAVEASGETLLSDDETKAALRAVPNGRCAPGDVDCLAKVLLLADAEALLSLVVDEDGPGSTILAVDALPRVGRAHAAADDDIGAAVANALASMRAQARDRTQATSNADAAQISATMSMQPTNATTTRAAPPIAARSPATGDPPPSTSIASSQRSSVDPKAAAPMGIGGPWALAGAGLAGAGIVTIGVGCVAGVLAAQSAHAADVAHFQDDAAKLGDEANSRLWVGGVAAVLGAGAVAAGAGMIVEGGT